MSLNSKNKGNHFEQQMVLRLKDVFPYVHTCRYTGNLFMDENKVDLTGTDPFYFQCKAQERTIPYHTILKQMPQTNNINVVLHKRNNSGVVAVLDLEDLLQLIKKNQK